MHNGNTAKLFVLAAPSGAGKTTLVKAVVKLHPNLKFSVSYTTRQQRSNEEQARDYFFVSEQRFLELRDADELLESALVFDNHYGTGRAQVLEHLRNGDDVLLEIDWQGAQQVRKSMPEAISVFILPPSVTELERRLRDRKTDSEEVIARRLRDSLSDISHWNEFTYVIVNDDLQRAVSEFEDILRGEAEANRVGNPAVEAAVSKVLETPAALD